MADGHFKVAAVQMLSFEGEAERNLARMLARIDEAAGAGAPDRVSGS
jgi:predicted amidohydrolase